MKASEFNPNVSVYSDIANMEGRHAKLKAATSAANDRISDEKMTAYGHLAAEIWDIKLVKGNLPKVARDRLWDALTKHGGLSKSKADRYVKNSVGVSRLREEFKIPTQATPEAIKDALIEADVTSEAKLTKRVAGDGEESDIERVVGAWVGKWTYRKDDDGNRVKNFWKPAPEGRDVNELIGALQSAQMIAEAANAEAAKAEDGRAAYEAVMATIDAS